MGILLPRHVCAWRHALGDCPAVVSSLAANVSPPPPPPASDTGKVGGKLLGMATTRDWDFVTDLHTPLSEVMTTDLETAQYGACVGSWAVQVAVQAAVHSQPAGQQGGWVGGQLGSVRVLMVHIWNVIPQPGIPAHPAYPAVQSPHLVLLHTCRHHHRREGDAAAQGLQARQAAHSQLCGGAAGAGHAGTVPGGRSHAPGRWVGGWVRWGWVVSACLLGCSVVFQGRPDAPGR